MLNRTVDSTFHVEERVHESHQKAAEQHELAARAHRTAAEHNEKGDNPTGNWHSERAIRVRRARLQTCKRRPQQIWADRESLMSTRYNNGSHYENHQRGRIARHGGPRSSRCRGATRQTRSSDGTGGVKASAGALRASLPAHSTGTSESNKRAWHGRIRASGHCNARLRTLAGQRLSRGITGGRLVPCRRTIGISQRVDPIPSAAPGRRRLLSRQGPGRAS